MKSPLKQVQKLSPLTMTIALLASIAGGLLVVYTHELSILLALAALIAGMFLIALTQFPLVGIYATTFFLPFEHFGSIEIGGSTLRISQVCAFLAMVAWILVGLGTKKLKFQKNIFIFPASLFVIANVISLYNAPNISRAIQVLVFTLFVMIFAFMMPNIILTKKHIEIVIKTLFVSALLVGAFGLFQFAGDVVGLPRSITGLREQYTKAVFGFPRIQSTALEPLYFANYLLLPIALALALYLQRLYFIKRSVVIGLSGLLVLNLVLTLSRGGFVGLAGVLAVLVIYFFKRVFSLRNLIVFGVLGGLIVFATQFFLQLSGLPKALDLFTEQATNYQQGVGIEERFSTYTQALALFDKHPWIGVGVGNFGPSVAVQPFRLPETGWAIVNNEFLEILAETGIIGLITFLLFIGSLFVHTVWRIAKTTDVVMRTILIALLAAFVGVFAQYQTFSTLYILHIWFLIGLLMSALRIAEAEQTPTRNTK